MTSPNHAYLKKTLGPSAIYSMPTGRPVGRARAPGLRPSPPTDLQRRPLPSRHSEQTLGPSAIYSMPTGRPWTRTSQRKHLLRMRSSDPNFYLERCMRCLLHPATQYAMRHSDVQMTCFGTDHNSGSWLWSVIPFFSLSSFDSG